MTGGQRQGARELVELGPQDAEAACAVMHRAFAAHLSDGIGTGALRETPAMLRADMAGGTALLGLHDGGELVAIVKARPAGDGTLYFSRLAVLPEAQGRGLAGEIVRQLARRASALGLAGLSCSVRAASGRNIAMYERLGLTLTGRCELLSLTGEKVPTVTMRSCHVADLSRGGPAPRGRSRSAGG